MKFQWFFEFFRLYPASSVKREMNRLNALISEKEEAVRKMETDLSVVGLELRAKEATEKKLERIANASIGDPAPSDEKQRAAYVAAVAQVAHILRPKFYQLVAQMREELDQMFVELPPGWSREQYDNFLRGTSNHGKLMLDWIDQMESEHTANITPPEQFNS